MELFNLVLDEMKQADSMVSGEMVLDGLTNVLAEPEFSGSEDARRAMRVLEEKTTAARNPGEHSTQQHLRRRGAGFNRRRGHL